MTSIAAIIDGSQAADGEVAYDLPSDWMQGRTAYGGLSSALALEAAGILIGDLPPLRSAMVSFVGPLAGRVSARARELRRGRNAVFAQVEISGDGGIGLTAGFVFMRPMESRLSQPAAVAPPFPRPGDGDPVFRGPAGMFIHNFELVDDRTEKDRVEWLRWVRLIERDGLASQTHLLAVADALPPAAMRLAGGPVPISSMTWQCNLLVDRPATDDGWWLLRSTSHMARNGCSSQDMAMWNSRGELVATGMQSVALFV